MKGFAAPAAITFALALHLSSASLAQQNDAPRPGGAGRLQLVARFEHQVTGVTVAADGRIFVNFPAGPKMPRSPLPKSRATAK